MNGQIENDEPRDGRFHGGERLAEIAHYWPRDA
jgi:hypothetical protein